MNQSGRLSTTTRIVVILGLITAVSLASAAEVTIAIVRDGPGPQDHLAALVEQELTNHTPHGTTVRFKSDPAFDAGWDYAAAREALQAAFDDRDVDLVLAIGSLVTFAAARSEGALDKPVISTFAQRADVFKLPYSDEGESLKPNLNFVVIPQRSGADIEAFRELVRFDTLHVAVTPEDLINQDELRAGLERYQSQLGIKIVVVPIEPDDPASVEKLRGASAVYLTRLQRFTVDQRRTLIEALNQRKVPTFSMLGHSDVELGALAGVTPEIEGQLVRRVALNLGRLLRGRPAVELPVLLSVDTRLRVNARTAAQIGYSPGRDTRIFAEFVHPEELQSDSSPLSFEQLFAMVQEGSRSLRVADSAVEGFAIDQDRARSGLLPQLSANLNYTHADTDVTDSEQGAFGSLALRQQIYDDGVWSSYRSSTQIEKSARLDRESERLDVLADAGQAFYALALAQAQNRIVAGDLRLTEDNLEMARLRREVGFSGREEVLRLESVLAERRTALFRAVETVEASRIALNQVLGVSLDSRWTPEPPNIDPDLFPVFDGRLAPIFDDFSLIDRVRSVIVEIAVANSPELTSFDRTIDAQRIQVNQIERSYVLPRFFAEASYSEQLNSPQGVLFPEDDNYSVSINAAYSIFEGGRRKADLGRAKSDEKTLSLRQTLLKEMIEQRTRTAIRRCESSFPRIKFGLQSARTAGESLELVREQYSEGTVNVTDLLDAQNQKLSAEQFSSSAIYEFMGDLVELQRAIAWFESDHTTEERDALADRILSIIAEEQP
ncbi:MAG: TolC family protein [Acidobacteriota bacterium]|nr:TolC family protein [Acidobacteriota bacterium]